MASSIGVLNEKPLHASLKELYAEPGDLLEAPVDGFVVDILRGERIVEIQTGSFASISRKLRKLVEHRPVRVVHPVSTCRWIVKLPAGARGRSERRRSPKKAGFEDVCEELVSFPDLLQHENFELDVLAIEEEEVRRFEARRRWRRRRGWTVVERRLLGVLDHRLLRGPSDLADLLPAGLPEPFQTSDLARALRRPRHLAQKLAYCLRKCGAISQVGKSGNSLLYTRTE
jgi:hypothetical protein